MINENIITKYIVLLLLICSQCTMGQQTCQTFIDGLEAKYLDFSSSSLTEQEKLYVQYSGIGGIRNIGDRISCEKQPSMNYYVLVHFGTDIFDTRIQVETGICIIKECTKEILSSNKEMMRSLFKVNNFPVTESDIIELYDMHESISKSVMFYLSTILHIAIVAFSICSTIIIYKRQRQRQRHQTTSITPEASQTQNHWLMEAFDIRPTLRALYQTAKEQKQNENIAVFGFLRIFGAYWILSAHAYGMTGAVAISPGTSAIPLSTFFVNGPFGVDCFFFMGGLLSVYVLVPKFQKEKLTLRSLFYHMKHRFVRIWPLCMAAVLFYLYVVRYMFKGPMWGRYGIADSCNKFWLSKIFLVDNLVLKGEGGCAVWTWYASVDLQGYIVVLLVVAVYAQSKLRGYIAAGLFMFMSIVIANDRYIGGLTTYYIYTPARVNEMLIGIVFGMHYYEYAKLKEKKNLYWLCERFYVVKYIVLLGGVALWYFVSYHVLQHQMVIDDWTVYSKCLMCLATALTFAPIITQKPFWLKSFLNLRLWQILGKLSFGIYLFHIPVMYAVLWTRDLPLESFSTSFMTYTTPRTILGATIVAAFYWIFLERPLLAIEAHSNKKPQPTSAASANVNEAITILQPASSKLRSDQNDSSIELAAKPLEQRGDSSPKPSKSLGIDKKSYQPLQES